MKAASRVSVKAFPGSSRKARRSVPPQAHLLTCARRAASCAETLKRWAGTDWPGPPRVHLDAGGEADAPEWGSAARGRRLPAAFAGMLRAALAEPGADADWLLLLEDDLDFHPRLAALVAAWRALWDQTCVLASLFNPSLQELRGAKNEWSFDWPKPTPAAPPPHAFAAKPGTFLGAQALLLRRGAARRALEAWPQLSGMQSQRLAQLFGGEGPIWVHRPSLVQHVATDSSWGARVQRALDFDPAWAPAKSGQKA